MTIPFDPSGLAPMARTSFGTVLGSFIGKREVTEASEVAIRTREAKTARHLIAGESVMKGDIYGGKDWNFLYTIGSKSSEFKEGALADQYLCYRIRRPLPFLKRRFF